MLVTWGHVNSDCLRRAWRAPNIYCALCWRRRTVIGRCASCGAVPDCTVDSWEAAGGASILIETCACASAVSAQLLRGRLSMTVSRDWPWRPRMWALFSLASSRHV
jgi:hypothetical protein